HQLCKKQDENLVILGFICYLINRDDDLLVIVSLFLFEMALRSLLAALFFYWEVKPWQTKHN
ncbi:MAG: hypothetical protein ABF624_08935, partial [Liquorilactobacillus ghanensis]|uniref:hypothetical protein n=1 Tax=Liquorilactobacillus ghanensis TaxID=399370 RepID=UPI0039EB0AD4